MRNGAAVRAPKPAITTTRRRLPPEPSLPLIPSCFSSRMPSDGQPHGHPRRPDPVSLHQGNHASELQAGRWVGHALLALVLVATIAQGALVVQNRSLPGLYAERYDGGDLFTIGTTVFESGANDRTPLGVEGNEVEMTDGYPEARTALTNGHQWYTAVIMERTASSVTSGTYSAQLYLQDLLKGTVFLRAGARTDKVDGATVIWDLGAPATVPASPLFVVRVSSFMPTLPPGPARDFGIESITGDLWRGVSAPAGHANIAGTTNPTLNALVGDSVRITWTNQDGRSHALQITNPGGAVVAGPTATLGTSGQSATVVYGPPSAGTYRYACVFHGSMWGNLAVA